MRRNSILIACALLLLSLWGCAKAARTVEDSSSGIKKESLISVTDLAGRVIELEKPATRIVDCTGLGGSRVLVQLEAEDLLVGITERVISALNNSGMGETVFHPISKAAPHLRDLPVIGKYREPNIETIISLKPDLILIGWGGTDQAEALQKQTGIPTVNINRMDGRFDYDIFQIIGKLTGREERAEELTQYMKKKLSLVTDITDKLSEEEKKSLFFWIYPTMERSPRSNGIYDAFDCAGAINVASNDKGVALYEMTKEQIASWEPDFIFLQSYVASGGGFYTKENIKEDPIMQHTQAVKNGNVHYLRGPISDWDTAVEAAEVFYTAKILYPEHFPNLDVEKQGNEILEKFYGVKSLYTEMSEYTKLHNWNS